MISISSADTSSAVCRSSVDFLVLIFGLPDYSQAEENSEEQDQRFIDIWREVEEKQHAWQYFDWDDLVDLDDRLSKCPMWYESGNSSHAHKIIDGMCMGSSGDCPFCGCSNICLYENDYEDEDWMLQQALNADIERIQHE